MSEQNLNNNKKDYKNIIYSIVGVMVLVAAVAGGTFAYYAFSVSNSTNITGTAATASVTMTVTKEAGGSGSLVPQLESTIQSAILGTNSSKCIDANGNTVCQIYKIHVASGATVATKYDMKIKRVGGTFVNLKYATLTAGSMSATQSTSVVNGTATTLGTTDTNIVTNQTITANGTVDQYIVIWLNETNSEQNSTDYGSFTGTVTFVDSAGNGITSTFTS